MMNLVILWDFDGTLVDSTEKNMKVTREVIKTLSPNGEIKMPMALSSLGSYVEAAKKYKNWRDLYQFCYGIPEDMVTRAGSLWSPLQRKNLDVPTLFNDMKDVLLSLNRNDFHMGICSQNCSMNIRRTLEYFNVDACFDGIIGYEDVQSSEQKPNPAGFFKCLDLLPVDADDRMLIVYIGDHQEDVNFAKNASETFSSTGAAVQVKTIAVSYSGAEPHHWSIPADYIADSPLRIKEVVELLWLEAGSASHVIEHRTSC